MTNFLPPRLTQEQYPQALHDAMERMPGIPARPNQHPYTSTIGGRENEAFAKAASLHAANAIPVRPEPRSMEEFSARGCQLFEDAAKLGLEVRPLHPQDAARLGIVNRWDGTSLPTATGVFFPGSMAPDTAGTFGQMEAYIARALANKSHTDLYRDAIAEREAERNKAMEDHYRRQAYVDNGPEIIESLQREIAELKAKNGATGNTGQAAAPGRADDPWAKHPGHWETLNGERTWVLDDTPENNALIEVLKAAKSVTAEEVEEFKAANSEASSRGFLNRFRRS